MLSYHCGTGVVRDGIGLNALRRGCMTIDDRRLTDDDFKRLGYGDRQGDERNDAPGGLKQLKPSGTIAKREYVDQTLAPITRDRRIACRHSVMPAKPVRRGRWYYKRVGGAEAFAILPLGGVRLYCAPSAPLGGTDP